MIGGAINDIGAMIGGAINDIGAMIGGAINDYGGKLGLVMELAAVYDGSSLSS